MVGRRRPGPAHSGSAPGGVPDADRAVPPDRNDPPPVGAEGGVDHPAAVRQRRADGAARGYVPDAGSLVIAGRDDPLPVWAERGVVHVAVVLERRTYAGRPVMAS